MQISKNIIRYFKNIFSYLRYDEQPSTASSPSSNFNVHLQNQKRDKNNPNNKAGKMDTVIGPEAKKMELIERLNEVIDVIGNTKNIGKCVEDDVIKSLQKIQEEAKIYDFKQIIKMVNLAIGKRILNLQLERKRTEIQNKIQKKRQIEEYFRENRIKKMQYEEIAMQKLQDLTFIVKPYNDGKGFIESTIFYEKVIGCLTGKSYQSYFEQCDYLQTIKKINKIFFNNFSNSSSEHSRKQAISNPLLKIAFVLFLVILCLSIGICFNSEDRKNLIYAICCANILSTLVLIGLAIWSFCDVKLANNQLDETAMEVSKYFEKINEENKAKGKRYEWSCHPEFLYLEVRFKRQNQSQESSIKSDKPLYSIKLVK